MLYEIKNQIVILKQKLNKVWLEESDCRHFNSEKKADLKASIVRFSKDLAELKDHYTVLIDEGEEAATRQAAIRQAPAKKRKLL
jgi:hypothetical protein